MAEASATRTRRSLLTAAAAAGGALAAQAIVRPSPVAAADVMLGAVNVATTSTEIRSTQEWIQAKAIVGHVTYTGAGSSTAGIFGQSDALNGSGVQGWAMSGSSSRGVVGQS